MSEEKAGSSSLNETGRPKPKKKYLYLDNFNKYATQHEELHEAETHAIWRFNFIHGLVTLTLVGTVLFLLIKS